MPKKKLNKLVRDRVPYELLKTGQKFQAKVLASEDFRLELARKILEESQEVSDALKEYLESKGGINTYHIEEELGDLLEVVFAFMTELKIKPKTVKSIMDQKRKDKGSFKDKIFLEWLEIKV